MAQLRKSIETDNSPADDTVEARSMDALNARGAHAMTEKELQMASGITGSSFKEVLIRLVRKKLVVKWKNEHHVNHIVAKTFAFDAYYYDTVKLNAMYVATGHSKEVITIKRTIPFVLLPDNELRVCYRNRYRDIKSKMS